MPYDELLALLNRARTVLDRYMFDPDGEAIRDDIAEVCMSIDDALPEARTQGRAEAFPGFVQSAASRAEAPR
jgi:hypothetical protein